MDFCIDIHFNRLSIAFNDLLLKLYAQHDAIWNDNGNLHTVKIQQNFFEILTFSQYYFNFYGFWIHLYSFPRDF